MDIIAGILKIAAVFFLVFLNGFFVAAEFAIVKVGSTQIETLALGGLRRAQVAKHVITHLDAYLSATQLGITLTSLLLGWVGEPFVGTLVDPILIAAGAAQRVPIDFQSGMTRLDMIELYNMATGYKITRDDYSKLGFLPLDMLVGDATKIAQEGHAIQDILSAATPAQDVQASHQAVLECVKARVAFSEGMVNSIKNLSPNRSKC